MTATALSVAALSVAVASAVLVVATGAVPSAVAKLLALALLEKLARLKHSNFQS